MSTISHRILGASLVSLALSLESPIHAQPIPTDLQPIAASDTVYFRPNYYSIQNFSKWPPFPFNWLSDSNIVLYVSASRGTNAIFVGDLDIDYAQRAAQAQVHRLAIRAANDGPPPVPGGGGGDGEDDYAGGTNYSAPVYTTNDLYLEIVAVTNHTASLVIHPPWTVTNGVYDLLYCTNLAPPISWQWLLRSAPGQTNLLVANATGAQGFYRLGPPKDLAAISSLGTNFWVALFTVRSTGLYPSLYISSPVGAIGTVTVPGLGITNTFSVAAGGGTNIDIDPSIMMDGYDMVETNGIHITASQPVSVYAVAYAEWTSSSFTGYPTTLLGTNYCVMARAPMDGAPGDVSPYSQFAIVATADNTTVKITPSPAANLWNHSETNYYMTINEGQTYQIHGNDNTNDVTGTWIASDKPIAVFAGANIAWVPNGSNGFGNPLMQEQLPVDSWGTQALALGFAERTGGDSYRVLAADDGTVVFTNGVVAGTNQAGQFLDLIIDGPVEFRGSRPIQVAQFANGDRFDGMEGDPCEILLPPSGHYLVTNTVATPAAGFDYNYLNIIVAQLTITNTLVDGSPVAATNFVAIGSSGYSGAQIPVETGWHTVTSAQPVGVQVYGFGETDAYGYFGGIVK